jgi:hypothetical protein
VAQTTRDRVVQTRLTEDEEVMLNRVARRMRIRYSDVDRLDGSLNTSAVIRHLIEEAARA